MNNNFSDNYNAKPNLNKVYKRNIFFLNSFITPYTIGFSRVDFNVLKSSRNLAEIDRQIDRKKDKQVDDTITLALP